MFLEAGIKNNDSRPRGVEDARVLGEGTGASEA